METVYLLRHGEVFNPQQVLYGRLPGFHLSDLGKAQAVTAGEFLAARDIAYLVASPLERAQETAAPLAGLTGLPIATDARLIEAGNRLEGRPIGSARTLLGDPRNWRHLRNPRRPSWGEPYAEIARRVLAAAAAARDQVVGTGRAAVCVSHQLPIVAAAQYARGLRVPMDPRKRNCALGSVTALVYDGDVVVDVRYTEPAAALPSGRGAGA